MSGVYIPNMEMPKSCKDCTRIGISHCPMKEEPIIVNGYDKPLNCPLVEVQTHGDLIDRQKLLEHRFEVYDSNEEVCEDYIETYHVLEAPSIVEASKER